MINKYPAITDFIKTMKINHNKSPYGGMSLDVIVVPDDLLELKEILALDKDLLFINKYEQFIENKLNNLIDEFTDKSKDKKIFVIKKSLFAKYSINWGAILDYASEIKEVQNA